MSRGRSGLGRLLKLACHVRGPRSLGVDQTVPNKWQDGAPLRRPARSIYHAGLTKNPNKPNDRNKAGQQPSVLSVICVNPPELEGISN